MFLLVLNYLYPLNNITPCTRSMNHFLNLILLRCYYEKKKKTIIFQNSHATPHDAMRTLVQQQILLPGWCLSFVFCLRLSQSLP